MEGIPDKYKNLIQTNYSIELRFIFSLLRNELENIKIAEQINWQEFLKLIAKHKLYPVIFQTNVLAGELLPPAIKDQLKEIYQQKTRENLHIAAFLLELEDLFESQNIDALWLKGPVLAMGLYQQLNNRLYGDLDVLISEKNIINTNKLLLSNGFSCELDLEKLNSLEKRFFLKYRNQLHYYNFSKHIAVELHWRLLNPNGLWNITFDGLFQKSMEVSVGNKNLKTLNYDHYFLYLAAHGALHQWSRLFWLRDIHTIIAQKKLNWDVIIELATKNKLMNVIFETCILSNLFFKTAIPMRLTALPLNKKNSKLIYKIVDGINKPAEVFQSRGIGHLKYIFYLSQIKNDFGYKLNCFAKLLVNSKDLNNFNLPAILFPLYFFKRFFSWFKFQYLARRKAFN